METKNPNNPNIPNHEIPEESIAKPKKYIILFPTVLLLTVSAILNGILFIQNQQLKGQLLQNIPTPPPSITPSPTVDPTADWKEFEIKTLGIKFKLPEKVYSQGEYSEIVTSEISLKGEILKANIRNSSLEDFKQIIFSVSSITDDYYIERGPSFDESNRGYGYKDNQYFITTNFGDPPSYKIPIERTELIKSNSGLEILKIKSNTLDLYPEPPAFYNEFDGYLGIINLTEKHSPYKAVTITITDDATSDTEEINQILSTFKFNDQESNQSQAFCESHEGSWLEEFQECEIGTSSVKMNEQQCEEAEGIYKSCESPCRHESFTQNQMCADVCVEVCSF